MKHISSMIGAALLLVVARPAVAQFQVTIDENGGGSYFGPNGELHTWGGFVTKSSPPVYHLLAAFTAAGQGFIPTPGDVVVSETATAQISSDLLRFDANGNLTVFSDIESGDVPPFDLADLTSGIPTPAPGAVVKLETDQFGGPPVEGGINGVFGYQPAPGTPGGYPAGTTGMIAYNFYSDGTVPEPSSLVELILGVMTIGLVCRRLRPVAAG